MTEKEKMINLKPLIAYEAMENDAYNKLLPGYDKKEEKDNYRRYNKRDYSNSELQKSFD